MKKLSSGKLSDSELIGKVNWIIPSLQPEEAREVTRLIARNGNNRLSGKDRNILERVWSDKLNSELKGESE